MIKKLLLIVFFVLVQTCVFSQTVGDYKSVSTGNWTTLSSWQYYNGTSWVSPSGTSPQGYPGEFVGTGSVLIQAGNTITMGTANLTTQNFEKLTINGALILDGGISGGVFTLNTLNIIVTSGLTPYANISFANKVTLDLPLDANIQVGTGGLPTPGNGICNNNITISIGGITYAYCTGGGSAANDFNDIMNLGGTGSATSNSPVCVGNSINLSASPPPSGGPYTYLWSGPNGFSSTSQNPTVISATTTPNTAGTYSVSMTSTTLSPNKSILAQTKVVVNSGTGPTAPAVTLTQPNCAVATGTITIITPVVGMKYSINGLTYISTTTFSSLAPGTYNVTAKNTSGCISSATSVTINAQPSIPSAPTVGTITQPTCAVATGSVILSGLPSGGTVNPGAIIYVGTTCKISSLATGTYNYTVSNGTCTSVASSNVVINAQPATPSEPTVGTITQPTCALATGSVILSGLPAGGTVNPGTITYVGTTCTISSLATGTYNYTVSNGTCTSVASSNVVINAQPATPSAPTVTAGSSTTFCSGGSVTLTSSSASGNTWSTGATTQSIIVSTGGTYNVSVNNGTCISATSAGTTVTVIALPSTPLVGTPTQPTCALATGSVVLSDLPASGTWTLTRSPGGETTSGTGTSTTISGLASGTYTYTVTNASGCISPASANVNINATTNTWNVVSGVGSWSNTLTNAQDITFNGNYDSIGDLTACSCTVNAGVSVNIYSGHTLTLTNGLTVDTSGFGDITFFDEASLVQINDVANSGDIDYNRTTYARKTDYTYWSSPVFQQTLGNLYYPYTLNGTFYSYEATGAGEDWSPFDAGTKMVAGKGYIANQGAEIPSGVFPPSDKLEVTFSGVPNNGPYPVSVFQEKSCLLGNPYPSAIDADTFLNDNKDVLYGTLYFWTHNTAIQDRNLITNPGSGAYAYTSNDYAVYNVTGGVASQLDKDPLTNLPYPSSPLPKGKIGAGQGFFATAKATGTVTFNNNMRVAGNNSQFFKKRNPKTEKVIEKNRVWLNLTNTQGAFKQTLVGYITDATNDYDNRFDGESFDGNEFVDFYSVNQDKNLVIQGRALPFDENDEVPLGYRTTINGDFTINIDQTDGLLTNQAVFIEDKLTNTVTDLKNGNYTFNTVAGTFNDRFVLRYTNKTLATSTFDSLENKVLVSNKNRQIKINSFAETIDKVTIYDLLGRQIYQKEKVNSNELAIANLVSSRQTLVVKTVLQNGTTVTDKIIY